VGCSGLQGVEVGCMLQCVAVCCSKFFCGEQTIARVCLHTSVQCVLQWVAVGCSALQCAPVCSSVLQIVFAVMRLLLECVTIRVHNVLQCVAVCCSVLQCEAV